MRKVLLLTVCAMWVTNGMLLAQDAKTSKDQKVESIRKLRSQVLSKLPALADTCDTDHNGMSAALGSLQKQYQDGIGAMNKRIEAENAKTADTRDQVALDQATAKAARI
jgi:adenosyl cobinamide kinase/adenosyl cobinamide phosphate guanylyltransferase